MSEKKMNWLGRVFLVSGALAACAVAVRRLMAGKRGK